MKILKCCQSTSTFIRMSSGGHGNLSRKFHIGKARRRPLINHPLASQNIFHTRNQKLCCLWMEEALSRVGQSLLSRRSNKSPTRRSMLTLNGPPSALPPSPHRPLSTVGPPVRRGGGEGCLYHRSPSPTGFHN